MATPPFEARVLGLLHQHLSKRDRLRLAQRRQQLREAFNDMEPADASALLGRLEQRNTGDELARSFHHRLATATRAELLGILSRKAKPSPQVQTAQTPSVALGHLALWVRDSRNDEPVLDGYVNLIRISETATHVPPTLNSSAFGTTARIVLGSAIFSSGIAPGHYVLSFAANNYYPLQLFPVELWDNNGVVRIDIAEVINDSLDQVIDVTLQIPTVKLKPIDHLRFNGKKLTWMKGQYEYRSWSGVSGAQGYQSPSNQFLKDKGPIPEGQWSVKQSDYQSAANRDWVDQAAGVIGRGQWRGGESAWGKHRIWLSPLGNTKTYGRSGFSIHGGDDPGSAGCVDLTQSMDDFVAEFHKYGKDLVLDVDYTD